MMSAQVKVQLDEVVGALEPCVVASTVAGRPGMVQCSGRRWRLVVHVRVDGSLTERHAPVVCDTHAFTIGAQQAGEVMQSADLRRAAAAAIGRPS